MSYQKEPIATIDLCTSETIEHRPRHSRNLLIGALAAACFVLVGGFALFYSPKEENAVTSQYGPDMEALFWTPWGKGEKEEEATEGEEGIEAQFVLPSTKPNRHAASTTLHAHPSTYELLNNPMGVYDGFSTGFHTEAEMKTMNKLAQQVMTRSGEAPHLSSGNTATIAIFGGLMLLVALVTAVSLMPERKEGENEGFFAYLADAVMTAFAINKNTHTDAHPSPLADTPWNATEAKRWRNWSNPRDELLHKVSATQLQPALAGSTTSTSGTDNRHVHRANKNSNEDSVRYISDGLTQAFKPTQQPRQPWVKVEETTNPISSDIEFTHSLASGDHKHWKEDTWEEAKQMFASTRKAARFQ